MDKSNGFYTMKGYSLHESVEMTSAMEDYLEMICRLMQRNGHVRVGELSKMLHVKAPSVTKMVQHLAQHGLIYAERYGEIQLTDKGRSAGEYLLYRHDVLHRFLCVLNHSENELEQVEKIEHFLNETTIKNLEQLISRLQTESI